MSAFSPGLSPRVPCTGWWNFPRALALLASIAALGSCSGPQIYSTSQHQVVSLNAGDLKNGGLAFITPSTVTGQEEDKQELALAVANVVREKLPDTRIVTLAETLGLINSNGLAGDYKHMYEDYRDTGIFKRETLKRIADAAGVRYVVQLKLASFTQGSKDRFSVLGIRILQTETSSIRLFFQIWDSREGTVAWEGSEEVSYAFESAQERGPALRIVAEEATRRIIVNLPQ